MELPYYHERWQFTGKKRCIRTESCGEYMIGKFRLNVSDFVKKVYLDYFGFPLSTNATSWIPSLQRNRCVTSRTLRPLVSPYWSALSLARSAQAERDNESCFFMRAAGVHRFTRRYHIKKALVKCIT
ncbi:hypothetical protein EVAR_41195_1 [Eumeta japonica]|uniref:Uncharacterized protein n=1 Tax=Eumeta variegata TaxID=151549 RepID=A0A4C1WPP4_EUMVA|nr:hypothetical protein EVAR_41195_1 [Eumeta japonica]